MKHGMGDSSRYVFLINMLLKALSFELSRKQKKCQEFIIVTCLCHVLWHGVGSR